MDHSKFIALIQKEEFISSFKEFCLLYLTKKSELHVCDETQNLVNLVLLSLTALYVHQIISDNNSQLKCVITDVTAK